jgi:hypothetical protein
MDQNLHTENLVSSPSERLWYILLPFLRTYGKQYIFHIKIQLIVTAKTDQDPDPDPHGSHWFGSLATDPH